MEILYNEPGNGYVGLTFNDKLNGYVLHIVCKEWSLATYKRYKKVGEVIRSELKSRGIKEVYGICADKKAVRFNKMFGAEVTGHMIETDKGYELLVKTEIE
jgi:hypothetical protein